MLASALAENQLVRRLLELLKPPWHSLFQFSRLQAEASGRLRRKTSAIGDSPRWCGPKKSQSTSSRMGLSELRLAASESLPGAFVGLHFGSDSDLPVPILMPMVLGAALRPLLVVELSP